MTNLQELLDERDIVKALGRFARILDKKEWADLGNVFAHDLSFNYGAGEEQAGISALEQTMRQFLNVCGPTQHLIGSVIVDVTGDEAVSRAYVQARHQRRDDPVGQIFDATGEYIDRWQRRHEGWRVARRDAVWFLHSGDLGVLAVDRKELDDR